jgi:hypothetical protein
VVRVFALLAIPLGAGFVVGGLMGRGTKDAYFWLAVAINSSALAFAETYPKEALLPLAESPASLWLVRGVHLMSLGYIVGAWFDWLPMRPDESGQPGAERSRRRSRRRGRVYRP